MFLVVHVRMCTLMREGSPQFLRLEQVQRHKYIIFVVSFISPHFQLFNPSNRCSSHS
jgi:hypothetical protein